MFSPKDRSLGLCLIEESEEYVPESNRLRHGGWPIQSLSRSSFMKSEMGCPTRAQLVWEMLTRPCCLGPARRIHGINRHQSGLLERVMTEAAPAPLRGFFDQTALRRIAGHVAQLLGELLRRPYIEVTETGLPESFGRRVGEQSRLRDLAAPRTHHPARNTLLQSFHHGREIIALGLAQQQVD